MLTVVVFGMGGISKILQYLSLYIYIYIYIYVYNEYISREIYKYFFRTSNQ